MLGLKKAVDFKISMVADTHARLGRTKPVDTVQVDLQAQMDLDEPAEWR
jgi:hypothetical protein